MRILIVQVKGKEAGNSGIPLKGKCIELLTGTYPRLQHRDSSSGGTRYGEELSCMALGQELEGQLTFSLCWAFLLCIIQAILLVLTSPNMAKYEPALAWSNVLTLPQGLPGILPHPASGLLGTYSWLDFLIRRLLATISWPWLLSLGAIWVVSY